MITTQAITETTMANTQEPMLRISPDIPMMLLTMPLMANLMPIGTSTKSLTNANEEFVDYM